MVESPSLRGRLIGRQGARAYPSAEAGILFGIVALSLVVRLAYGPHLRDDAYITLRYASHLAAGFGFTFNPGERVLGTTTPLFTLLIAVALRLGVSAEVASVALGVGGDLAVAALLWWYGRRVSPTVGLLAAAIYSLLSPTISYAVSGMETSLYLAGILLSLVLISSERSVVAAASAGILTLLRPDGSIVMATLLGVLVLSADRQRGLGSAMARVVVPLGVYLLVLLPWVTFASWYFHSPVPQSLVAKWDLHIGRGEGLVLFASYFLDLGDRWFLPLTGLAAIGIADARRRAIDPALALWTALYTTSFLATNKFVYPAWPFEWYYLPLLIPYSLAVAQGIARIRVWLTQTWPARRIGGWLANILVAAIVLALLGHDVVVRTQLDRLVSGREGLYSNVATWLLDRGITNDQVAAPEIGALGFFYPGPIFDLWGLVSPKAAGTSFAQSLREEQPTWFVAWSTDVPDSLRSDPWFDEHYRPVYIQENWESRRLITFRWYSTPAPRQDVGPVIGGHLELLDRSVTIEDDGSARYLRLRLVWKALDRAPPLTVSVQALDPQGQAEVVQDNPPQEGTRPTDTWIPGRPYLDLYDLRLPIADPAPSSVGIVVYPTGAPHDRFTWVSPAGSPIGSSLQVPILPAPPAAEASCSVRFEHGVTLAFEKVQVSPSATTVVLDWSATQVIREDLTVFIHILDDHGRIIGQADGPPGGGSFPTSAWIPGDHLVDVHQATGSFGAARAVEVGLYQPPNGQRLALANGLADHATVNLREPSACLD